APGTANSPLPAAVQTAVEKLKVRGQLNIEGSMNAPFRELDKAEGTGRLQLQRASVQFKDVPLEEVQLTIDIQREAGKPARVVPRSTARVGGSEFAMDAGLGQVAGGALLLRDLHAQYGQDNIRLGFARLIPGHPVRLENLVGEVTFHSPSPPYPPPLAKLVARLNPDGIFHVLGNTTLDKPVTKMDLTVSAPDARLSPTQRKIPFTRVHGAVHIDEQQSELHDVAGKLMDGDVTLAGTIETPRPHAYELTTTVKGVNVEALTEALALSEKEQGKLWGQLDGRATIKGKGSTGDRSALENMVVAGEVECHDGDLWNGRVLNEITQQVKAKRDALSSGEAAAVFEIKERVVYLKSAAINSPLLGLQGSGSITFDKELDLDVVAAPLGDWKMNLKKLKIPIVSDVTGEIAGAVQKLLTAVTSELLYQFKVTGQASEPKIQAIPTPILTETAAAIFGRMTRDEAKEHALLEAIREEKRAQR
ncbi:MAG: AsmA-like C-terminal region-containing protein, partial [Opitutaceae bacterium]